MSIVCCFASLRTNANSIGTVVNDGGETKSHPQTGTIHVIQQSELPAPPVENAIMSYSEIRQLNDNERTLLIDSWAMDYTEMAMVIMQTLMKCGDLYPQHQQVQGIAHLMQQPRDAWMNDAGFRMKTVRTAQVNAIKIKRVK